MQYCRPLPSTARNVLERLPLILTSNAGKGISLSEAIAQKNVEIDFFLLGTRIAAAAAVVVAVVMGSAVAVAAAISIAFAIVDSRITCREGIIVWWR
jgi:hypothetical protein